MKKAITISAVLCAAILAYATVTGEYNTWFGFLAGEDASGNRATVFGAGAGGGAQDIYRTDLIGAAAGVGGYRFRDTVAIGYRALRDSMDMSNTVAIGSHALEGVGGMGETYNATWINGHFVANPPRYDEDSSSWQQTQGEFYITGDASLTNGLAPIWYDGTNLHLRGYTPEGGGAPSAPPNVKELMAGAGIDYIDPTGAVWTAKLKIKKHEQLSQLDPADADEITYFTETDGYSGVRAWIEDSGTGAFFYAGGTMYYVPDRSGYDVGSPEQGASWWETMGAPVAGTTFNMWTPNVTTCEYDGYWPRDTAILKSNLRQALIDLGVTVTQ